MTNMKRNACQKCVFAVDDDKPHCGLRGFRSDFNVERCSAENDTLPNGYELQEDGYFSWVEKKKEYPKTYEECCKVMGIPIHGGIALVGNWCMEDGYIEQHLETLRALSKLLICRDAYWKIAGEEMGLGKPWEPDWNTSEPKYVIACTSNGIEKQWETTYRKGFAFPTAEMRDAFYDNFKNEIEICKELL